MECATANGIEIVQPLDPGGKFTSMVPPYEGLQVFDANPVIIKDLKAAGKLLRHETIEHSYPHSWRSGQPLIYMAVPSWFVAVTKFRDRMVELNQEITWVPEHIRDGQFGKWLEGAATGTSAVTATGAARSRCGCRTIRRTRESTSTVRSTTGGGLRCPPDRPAPADDRRAGPPQPDDPTGKSMMRRVPEVLDCWFESGSMPYAQVHYRSRTGTGSTRTTRGDFIVEYTARPAAGSTRCTCWRPRCSTARLSNALRRTASSSATTVSR